MGNDVLYDALCYALDHSGGARPPVAVFNACGFEDSSFVKQSDHACYNLKSTIDGAFCTILVRATRQIEQTLGIVAQATAQAQQGGLVYVAQENAHGANNLEKHLTKAFGEPRTFVKHKCRIMALEADKADRATLDGWAKRASIQKVAATGLWSAPGLFAWDRFDVGSSLLLEHLPPKMEGLGADLGCGYGYLSLNIIKKQGVKGIHALDSDYLAVKSCEMNLIDAKTGIEHHVLWRDATSAQPDIPKLDWVVMNPPFHTQQHENRALGQKFCTAALKMLKSRGMLYIVANRHMPYEALLSDAAHKVECLADQKGFKILRVQAK